MATVIASQATRREDRDALRRHAHLVYRAAQDGLYEESDRKDVDERMKQFESAVRGDTGNTPAPADLD